MRSEGAYPDDIKASTGLSLTTIYVLLRTHEQSTGIPFPELPKKNPRRQAGEGRTEEASAHDHTDRTSEDAA